jgi:D-alanine transfer protein
MTPGSHSRLLGVAVGLGVCLAALGTPLAAGTVYAVGMGSQASVAALSTPGTLALLRDPQRYERALDAADGVAVHYLMGSSEISSVVPQNPIVWLPGKASDFTIFMSGRGHVQSLSHAIELAAVADRIRSRKVTLVISPQWFTSEGVMPQAFADVFSYSFWEGMLANSRLSAGTRERIVARAAQLGGPGASVRPDKVVDRQLHVLKEALSAAKDQRMVSAVQSSGRQGSAAAIDWAAERAAAARQGQGETHNPYYVANPYFARYVRDRLDQTRGEMKGSSFLSSPEYDDLDIFLTVARELGIEVMLVSVPMNGWWYDHLGYEQTDRARYYAKIREVATAAGARFADFSDREYEPYFLYDIMHLGWKGWLDVTRACLDFERTA